MNATLDSKYKDETKSSPIIAKIHRGLKQRRKHSRGKTELESLSLELSYSGSPHKQRRRATIQSTELSKSVSQPNLKKSADKQIRRRSTFSDFTTASKQRREFSLDIATKASKSVPMKKEKATKPKKVLRYADRVRCKRAVDYSSVDASTNWYSPAEILELRKAEQEVLRGLAFGYSRADHNSTVLNAEGLNSRKQQLAMSKRRADSKKMVFDFQNSRKGHVDAYYSETLAAEYGKYSKQASRRAQQRAGRLSSHVSALWNPQEDESDDDSWPDEEGIMMNDDIDKVVGMLPSLMPRISLSYRPKVMRNASNSNLLASPTSFSTSDTVEDNNEEAEKEPTLWRSFKRQVSRV